MSDLLDALDKIPVASLNYQEWINIGMALKHEGYTVDDWARWSAKDSTKFHNGECEAKWKTFEGSAQPVTGATIFKMAQDHGYRHTKNDGVFDWDDWIEFDNYTVIDKNNLEGEELDKVNLTPVDQLKVYLETLFNEDDYVAYTVKAIQRDNKWRPGDKGVYTRTAGMLIRALEKPNAAIDKVIGDYNKGAGAWIRFNPFDGAGVKDTNVTDWRYALIESDTADIETQNQIIRDLQLPVACLVSSGGKSLHAIVKIDAPDSVEYRKRVEFLYKVCGKNGLPVDEQNRNPSRLSRMPGVQRGGKQQELIDTNIGCQSWSEWRDWIDEQVDNLPDTKTMSESFANPPELKPEVIEGVLRKGHKMIVTGDSKAGKSFLMIELAAALAEGKDWLGLRCRKSKVFYINLEIDEASFIDRASKVYDGLGYGKKHTDDFIQWPLRGKALPLDQLVPSVARRVKKSQCDVVIVDPIYKVITGDENNATDMAFFTNQFDRIAEACGAAVIYCHHHAKGNNQGEKKAIDRGSGSGVFARDADAIVDLCSLPMTKEFREEHEIESNVTAYRAEFVLREFAGISAIDLMFRYPIHEIDYAGILQSISINNYERAADVKSEQSVEYREKMSSKIYNAYTRISVEHGVVTVDSLAQELERSARTIRDYIKNDSRFTLDNGKVIRN